MIVLVRIVVGVLLLAHGLVHLLYLSADTLEFSIDESWLLPPSVRRPIAGVLMAVTVAAFAVLAAAVWQVPGLRAAWVGVALVAAGASTLLLVVFWNWRLVLGLLINAAVVTLAVIRPAWLDPFVLTRV